MLKNLIITILSKNIYDSRFFTQELETFSCLAFLSNGTTTIPPQKIDMYPYFKER